MGPPFGVKDTIGCGVTHDGSIYYTINGHYLGTNRRRTGVSHVALIKVCKLTTIILHHHHESNQQGSHSTELFHRMQSFLLLDYLVNANWISAQEESFCSTTQRSQLELEAISQLTVNLTFSHILDVK